MTPEVLADLHAQAFTTSRPWSAAEFAELLAQKGTVLIGDARCFAVIRITLDEAELLTITTAPNERRQGHGRAVLAAAEAQAASHGAAAMFLEVADDNTAARRLYAAANFTIVGRRKGYYARAGQQAVAALVMRKEFPAE
ncbi:MAG: GNAT family N-acetyltransferase [Pseudomonadota bacterium]